MAIVRLIAINPKYRTVPFFMTPVYDESIRGFRTGQEDMTKEQLTKEPFIIDPEEQYAVVHMQAFDTNNVKDNVLLRLAKKQPLIAPSSSKVVSGRHLFYIEDKESEAGEKIIAADLMYEAMSKVREDMTLQRITDLAIFLGVDTKNNPISVIQERIYSRCTLNPKEVLSFFSADTKNRMFMLKLIHHGIVQRRLDRVVDGDLLIGRNTEEAILFIQDKANDQLVGKWGLALDRKEGREPIKKEKTLSGSDVPDAKKLGNNDDDGKSDTLKEVERLRKILDEKGVKYHPMHGLATLQKLVEENK